MALGKIRYKDFQFPNNPETTGFKCGRSYVAHKYPDFAGNELEDFSVDAISITGSGYFFGSNAYNDFRRLYTEYQKNGVGNFYHPIFTQVTRGLMVKLDGEVNPEKNAIRYSFEIIADTKPSVQEGYPVSAVMEVVSSVSEMNTGSKTYKVGDIVNFHGGMHYVSSYSYAKGGSARAGKAKITLGPGCKGHGGAHPWHLIHIDNKSNVYGWVDEGTFD